MEHEPDDNLDSEATRLVLETQQGAVWHVAKTGHFWIRFGSIRWQMDVGALAAYRNYIRSVLNFISREEGPTSPIYLRTRDPAICLAFEEPQLRELAYLLDASETLFSIERSHA